MVGLDGALRVQGYMPLAAGTSGLFIMAGLDKAAALAPIHGTMWRSLGVLGATALLALAAVWWGARRYIRAPVRALVAATERWREGDYAARANLRGGGSELVALGRAFDAMAESLEAHDRVREEAHAAARKVAEVFGCMTDSVFEVDRDWRITFMNERARIESRAGAGPGRHEPVGGLPGRLWAPGSGRLSPGHGRAGADRGRGLLPAAPEMVPVPRLPVARGPGLLWSGRHRAAAASRRTWSASGRCWRPSSRARPIPSSPRTGRGGASP